MTIPTRSTSSTLGVRFDAAAPRLSVLLLVAAVLTWGIGYKISLYAAPLTSQTSIPPARLLAHRICLLNRSQRSGFPDDSAPARIPAGLFTPVLSGGSLDRSLDLLPALSAMRMNLPAESRPGFSFAATHRFSRPPPVFA